MIRLGHSAQYYTYSLADMNDHAILQMNIVDVREAAGKSNNMDELLLNEGWTICSHQQCPSKKL